MIDTADIGRLAGSAAVDRDGGRIGPVGRVVVSEDGRQPLLVAVRTGRSGEAESFVPVQGAELRDGLLRLQYDAATIRAAPRVHDGGVLTDDERGTIFDYYDGRAGGAPSGLGGVPAGFDGADAPAEPDDDPAATAR